MVRHCLCGNLKHNSAQWYLSSRIGIFFAKIGFFRLKPEATSFEWVTCVINDAFFRPKPDGTSFDRLTRVNHSRALINVASGFCRKNPSRRKDNTGIRSRSDPLV